MVQLKDYLTQADRAHTTYPEASSFINLYWHVLEGKPANITL